MLLWVDDIIWKVNIYRLYNETEGYTRFRSPRKNQLFRRPECVARGRLIWFSRWSKSRIPRLFHRIRHLCYTLLTVCLSVAAKYCSRVLEAYRNRQDHRHRRLANIAGQHVVWMITLVIAPSLCYFPFVEPLWALIRLSLRHQCYSLV